MMVSDVCAPISNRTTQFDRWVQNNLDAYKRYCSVPANSPYCYLWWRWLYLQIRSSVFLWRTHSGWNVFTDHQSLCTWTIEEAMGLTVHAGAAASRYIINYCWSATDWGTEVGPDAVASKYQLQVYPNPATDVLNIDFITENAATVSLYMYAITGAGSGCVEI